MAEAQVKQKSRWRRALEADSFEGLSNSLFGEIVDEYAFLFRDLRGDLQQAGIKVLFRTYVSQMIAFALFVFVLFLTATGVFVYLTTPPVALSIVLFITAPSFFASLAFVFLHQYPSFQASQRASGIDSNLPFALNQMSAVALSGISPSSMFKLLQNFEEYDELAKESEKIVRKVDIFGEDITTALSEVAQETPSSNFREVLYGMVSTIETGGDLNDFLAEQAESAMFDYRLRREKQIEQLSTFASFYTALLVVAPLFLVVIMSVMNIIGGGLLGFSIEQLMNVGVYAVIPVLNVVFVLAMELGLGEF